MINRPSDTLYSAIEPYAKQYGVPDALWEAIAFDESGYNPAVIGDFGTSYGIFQLHQGGQADAAYAQGYTSQDLLTPGINARFGMPALGRAWSSLKGSFNNSAGWWAQFFAASGHPGGSASDPITQAYEKHFFSVFNQSDFSGLGTGGVGSVGSANTAAFAWARFPVVHGYISTYNANEWDTPHYAIDLATPFHTVVTALKDGIVTTADYAIWSGLPGGGEVFVKPTDGSATYYFYHLDVIQVSVGDRLFAGQPVGLSGGQNSGGSHPVAPAWSGGPHLHVGYFTKWINTPIGSRPYGPDITPLLQQVATSGVPISGAPISGGAGSGGTGLSSKLGFSSAGVAFTSVSAKVKDATNNVPGFLGICLALDAAETFPGLVICSTDPSQNDFNVWGIDTGVPNPFAVVSNAFGDEWCTIWSTVTGNMLPFFVRSLLIVGGALLLLGLIMAAANSSGIPQQVASVAGAAAI